MIQKIAKISAIVLVSLIALLAVLPFVFKGKITELVKREINNQVNAKVDFGKVKLSFLRSFPSVYFAVEDVEVFGIDEFEGVPLALIDEFAVKLDVMAFIRGNYHLKSLTLDKPILNIVVLESGKANYDIAKPSQEDPSVTAEPTEPDDDFTFALKRYAINEGKILYEDKTLNFSTKVVNLNHAGSGDFTLSKFILRTETSIEALSLEFDGIKYFKELPVQLSAQIEMDLENFKFTFVDNLGKLGVLPIQFNGFVAMPTDDIAFDLTYGSPGTTFKDLLSFVPEEFLPDLQGASVQGDVIFGGSLFGIYNEETMPGFTLKVNAEKGVIKYPDMPLAVENINFVLAIESQGGKDYDNTVIDFARFGLTVDNNPISAFLKVTTPISDPNITAGLTADFSFAKLKNAIPFQESFDIAGSLKGDVMAQGAMSSIEKEEYEKFEVSGVLALQNFKFATASLPYAVEIPQAQFSFSPQFLELAPFQLQLGASDFALTGRLENYLAYALKSETLRGRFSLESKLIDANELMPQEEPVAEKTQQGSAEGNTEVENAQESALPQGVFAVPANLDISFTANIGQLLYENYNMTKLEGRVAVKNERADLSNFRMEMLDGSITMAGFYETVIKDSPNFNFNFNIKDFDIKKTAETFVTVEKMAPIAKNSTGRFSTGFSLSAVLQNDMTPVYNTLNGKGSLQTRGLKIPKFELLDRLDNQFKLNLLKSDDIEDINVSFEIINGKIYLKPFDIKVGAVVAKTAGDFTIETQEMDMVLETIIPIKTLGKEAASLLGSAVNRASSLGINLEAANAIPVTVNVTGTYSDTKYAFKVGSPISGTGKSVEAQVRQQIESKIDDALKSAEEELRKQREEAERRAREEAERIRREAEERARREADELKRKAEEEAKRKLRNLFK